MLVGCITVRVRTARATAIPMPYHIRGERTPDTGSLDE